MITALTIGIITGCSEDGSKPEGGHVVNFGWKPVFSPDGGKIAFGEDDSTAVWIYWLNGDLEKIIAGNHNGDYCWSPSGDKLAYSVPGGLDKGLWTVDTTGSKLKLSDFGAYPSWSPSGDSIVFHGYDYENSICGLFITASDGGGSVVNITLSGEFPQWSPAGDKIAYLIQASDYTLFIYYVGTGANSSLTSAGPNFDWSPDGGLIVFDRFELTGSGANQYNSFNINVKNLSGGSAYILWQGGNTPVWSPDNSYIAFENMSGDISAGILTISPSGGTADMITNNGYEPSISPNGSKIAFRRSDGIWIIDK